VYSVETDVEALGQVAALPGSALPAYAELMILLEIAPWSGDAYNRQRPDANMRTHPFGDHGQGLIIYLILRSATPGRRLARALGRLTSGYPGPTRPSPIRHRLPWSAAAERRGGAARTPETDAKITTSQFVR